MRDAFRRFWESLRRQKKPPRISEVGSVDAIVRLLKNQPVADLHKERRPPRETTPSRPDH